MRVLLRTRPKATADPHDELLKFHQDQKTLTLQLPIKPSVQAGTGQATSGQQYVFKFDALLHDVAQETMVEACVPEAIQAAIQGFNSTIMCYGQTGAGKTYTMAGGKQNYKSRGIIPRSISHLFAETKKVPQKKIKVQVGCFVSACISPQLVMPLTLVQLVQLRLSCVHRLQWHGADSAWQY